MIIREACLNDLDELKLMEQALIEAERPFDAVIKSNPVYYYDLENLITNKQSCLLVAEHETELVACGYAQLRNSKPFLSHGEHSYLGFMYVKADYRGQQLVGQIINQLFFWSRDQGVEYCTLDVYSQNAAAIRAYEKLGFSSLTTEMKCRIPINNNK